MSERTRLRCEQDQIEAVEVAGSKTKDVAHVRASVQTRLASDGFSRQKVNGSVPTFSGLPVWVPSIRYLARRPRTGLARVCDRSLDREERHFTASARGRMPVDARTPPPILSLGG